MTTTEIIALIGGPLMVVLFVAFMLWSARK